MTTPKAHAALRKACVSAASLLAIALAVEGRAGEIRLRPSTTAAGRIVTLGDVAEVSVADPQEAERLNGIELFPAPPAASQRFLRLRELQDLLMLRGVNLLDHQFAGAMQVVIQAGVAAPPAPLESAVSTAVCQRAERLAADAITAHLRAETGSPQQWQIRLRLSEDQTRVVAASRSLSAAGGSAPWTGPQRFVLTAIGQQEPVGVPVDAVVEAIPAVVVATRAIPSGEIIRAEDVSLEPAAAGAAGDAILAIEEVVGQQAIRAIQPGRALDRASVRAPLMVRRGEIVTVFVRRPGLCVRTTARARDDGFAGKTISVEEVESRKSYLVRVCGAGETEIVFPANTAMHAQGQQPAMLSNASMNRSWR